jgi:hypothetical protein
MASVGHCRLLQLAVCICVDDGLLYGSVKGEDY